MSDRERVEALAPMLADEIRMYGHAHGSWLPLDLARHLAKQLADSPAMRDLLAEAKADALREAADAVWQESGVQWGRPDWIKWLRDRAVNHYRETGQADG